MEGSVKQGVRLLIGRKVRTGRGVREEGRRQRDGGGAGAQLVAMWTERGLAGACPAGAVGVGRGLEIPEAGTWRPCPGLGQALTAPVGE